MSNESTWNDPAWVEALNQQHETYMQQLQYWTEERRKVNGADLGALRHLHQRMSLEFGENQTATRDLAREILVVEDKAHQQACRDTGVVVDTITVFGCGFAIVEWAHLDGDQEVLERAQADSRRHRSRGVSDGFIARFYASPEWVRRYPRVTTRVLSYPGALGR